MPYRRKVKQGHVWVGSVMVDGARRQGLFETKAEARRWEEEEKARIGNRLKSETDMAFLPLCNKYLDFVEPRMTAKTFDEKRSLCSRLVKVWGAGRSVYSITPEMVMEYLSQQAKARSNYASNRDRKNLLAMWNWGRKLLGVNHDPLTGIDQLPHKRATQYTPSQADVLKVMAAATRTEGVFLSCYLQTGARRSEIFNLTWDDVNFEGRAITLSTRKTKGGEVRRDALPMSEKLYSELKGWYANRDRPFRNQPYVFVCDHPGPNYGQPFKVRRKFLSGLCKRAGVRPFGFHALRRFVASWLADHEKVSSKVIQRVLRHQNLATTERYIQRIDSDLMGTMNRLRLEKTEGNLLHDLLHDEKESRAE